MLLLGMTQNISMTKSNIFIGSAISFAGGIAIGSAWEVSMGWLLLTIAAIIGVFGFSFYFGKKTIALAALFLLVACLGMLRIIVSQVPSQFGNLYNTKPELEGFIVEDIDVRTDKQLVTFEPEHFSQRILLTAALNRDFFYGDKVVVTGTLTEAKSSPDFDYKTYLQRFNVYGLEEHPQILVLKTNQKNKITWALLKIKSAFVSRLSEFYQEPQNSLLLGILIGAKKTLPQNIVDNFNATGTSHIIAISGFNITIIILGLGYLTPFLGRRISFWLSVCIIAAFVICTGASASVLRAAVMGSLLLISFNIGRQYRITAALFFAAAVMLLINPKILFVDVGFQLSFAATMGIIYFTPLLEQLTVSWENPFNIKTVLLTTLSAMLPTLPLLLSNFGILSLSAPLVNMLILPLVPPAMLLGFLSILPFVGSGFAFATTILLNYILKVTEFFANLRYGTLTAEISGWFFWVLVLANFLVYFILQHLSQKAAAEAE